MVPVFQRLEALEKQIPKKRITILDDKPCKRDKNKIYKNIGGPPIQTWRIREDSQERNEAYI